MKTQLIASTMPVLFPEGDGRNVIDTTEKLIVYTARASSPSNQLNTETGDRLLRYCMRHGHWSVFETASMTVEVETTRAIAAQILRHRSFTFQEFSQRYASVDRLSEELFELPEMRAKHTAGNRQGSGDEVGETQVHHAVYTVNERVGGALRQAAAAYRELLDSGVAPECARMVLPLCTKTRMYVTGTCRSWIHYFSQRCSDHAQKEHREIAVSIRDGAFKRVFPVIHGLISEQGGAA
jgi:thymidylate synthase (FAD)